MGRSSLRRLLAIALLSACTPSNAPAARADEPVEAPATPTPPSSPPEPVQPPSSTYSLASTSAVPREMASRFNGFGLALWKAASGSDNAALSPASIVLALEMTRQGAAGVTREEMTRVMGAEGASDDYASAAQQAVGRWSAFDEIEGVTLALTNRLFGEATYAFEQPFIDGTRDRFGAPLETLDFRGASDASRSHINEWVSQRTARRIQNLIPAGAIDAQTRLVLVNALYFNGQWATAFNEGATRPQPFHRAGGDVNVPTMQRTASYAFLEEDDVLLAEIPYRGNRLSMVVALPKALDGLAALESSLDAGRLDRWMNGMGNYTRLALALPRFRVEPAESIALSETLRALGMRSAFERQQADFRVMANPPSAADRLYISEVFHKAFVAVDEAGTEAAAATAVVMGRAGSAMRPAPPRPFTVDRPFLFFIRDTESGAILFMGRVVDPS